MLISQDQKDASIELVGGKGQGLLGLKSLEARLNDMKFDLKVEVPDFFIIPPEVELDSATAEILARAEQIGSVYAVRSSSALEDVGEHSFDGIFDSVLDVQQSGLIAAIEQVRRSATAKKAQRYSAEVGVALDGRMPVIVQRMVTKRTATGVAYSRFPCFYDITKVIIDEDGHRMYDAFPRLSYRGCKPHVLGTNSLVIPEESGEHGDIQFTRSNYYSKFHKALARCAVFVENELGDPRILEFAFLTPCYGSCVKQDTVYLFQARKCTKFPTEVLHLHEDGELQPGFIAKGDTNGVGEYVGPAYVIRRISPFGEDIEDRLSLPIFDSQHPEGYVLVTPHLETNSFDQFHRNSPHKKAVVAYGNLGTHHDLELTRKARILYVNINNSFHGYSQHLNIQTGDIVRVVSDGLNAFVYNLSRN